MINRNLFTRRPSTRHAIAVGALALAGITAPLALMASGRVINVTDSLSDRVIKTVPIAEAKRGDYVSFCRPLPVGNVPRGNCPDGSAPLVKRVIAVAGDTVFYTPTEIKVEYPGGWFVIHEMRHVHAGKSVKNRLPNPSYGADILVQEGQVVVQGDHPLSLDSRYFGAISDPSRDIPPTYIPTPAEMEAWERKQ